MGDDGGWLAVRGARPAPTASGQTRRWVERGCGPRCPLPPPCKETPRAQNPRPGADEQDPGFGRDGAKSASWMPFLGKALLLPPHLGVALLTSSPCTDKYMHTRAGHMLNYGVGMCGRRFPHGQPRK